VATLAHELGHAVHSLLAAEHSVLTQHPSLPLAETASVFTEMLLTDRLLAEESDPLARRELLAASMDDIYATVMRQAYFTRFEIAAHQALREGKPPSALDEIYAESLREQFGDAVELSDEFRREWVAIPHLFQAPFYCYAYSFGQLLVLSLYQRFRERGEAFIPGYLRLLAYGGSARPQQILAEVAVDIDDADFWRGGFRIVERMIDNLESLG
jgi:oligoendopeptidase F